MSDIAGRFRSSPGATLASIQQHSKCPGCGGRANVATVDGPHSAELLTLIVPLAVGLKYLTPLPHLAAFVLGGLAVSVLALWMRRATDQIAKRAGSAIGGLLNVSFGSAAELILMLLVVMGRRFLSSLAGPEQAEPWVDSEDAFANWDGGPVITRSPDLN